MDRDEARYHHEATRQNLSLTKNDDGTWSLGAIPSTAPLGNPPHVPIETFISGDRIRLADGRVFKRVMTTDELKAYLGVDV